MILPVFRFLALFNLLALIRLFYRLQLFGQHFEVYNLIFEFLPIWSVDRFHIGYHLSVMPLLYQSFDIVESEKPEPEQMHEAENNGQPYKNSDSTLISRIRVFQKLPHEVGLSHAESNS